MTMGVQSMRGFTIMCHNTSLSLGDMLDVGCLLACRSLSLIYDHFSYRNVVDPFNSFDFALQLRTRVVLGTITYPSPTVWIQSSHAPNSVSSLWPYNRPYHPRERAQRPFLRDLLTHTTVGHCTAVLR